MSNITDNPLIETSYNPNDTTAISSNPTGIPSPPPFYTKRPNRISKITRFKFLPKRKPCSNQTPHNVRSKSNTQSSLPHYSSVTTNPNDYTLNTSPVVYEMDTPVRIYSKTSYSFPPPSFNTDHSNFFTPPTAGHCFIALNTFFTKKLLSLQKFSQFSNYFSLRKNLYNCNRT